MNQPTHHEKAVRFLNDLHKCRPNGAPEPFVRLNYPHTEFDQTKFFVQYQDERGARHSSELILFADGGWRFVV